MRKGEIDLAVTGQEGALASNEFYTRKLETLPVVAILPADHPLAARKKISLKQLKGDARFSRLRRKICRGRDRWVSSFAGRRDSVPHFTRGGGKCSQAFSLISSEGPGVAGAGLFHERYPAAGVAMVPISDEAAKWDFLIVWQRGRLSVSMKAMLDALSKNGGRAARRRGRSEIFALGISVKNRFQI